MSLLRRWMMLLAVVTTLLGASACSRAVRIEPLPAKKEIRGVWVTNVDSDVLSSKARIAEAMDSLAAHGFNVVYPVVWNKAMTLYPSDVMEKEFGVRIDPRHQGRDPLAELIVEAHRNGMEVIPWFEFGFSSSYNANGGPILEKRPEWKGQDQTGRLLKKNGFEWMNAMDPAVQEFMSSLILEVAQKYDVDGIQGDDRLPAMPSEGGYDPITVAAYKAKFGKEPPTDWKEPQWVQFRSDILSDWLADLRKRVKAIDEDLIISMSPNIYDWCKYEYLQDSKTWRERGLVDTIHPQAYRYDLAAYQRIINDMVNKEYKPEELPRVAPGLLINLGKYRIDQKYFLDAMAYNREKGLGGEVFFFYEGLRKNDDELLGLLTEMKDAEGKPTPGFYAQPAALPWRKDAWRPGAIFAKSRTPVDVVISSFGRNFFEAPAGKPSPIKYTARVPASGTYDIYVDAPSTTTGSPTYYEVTSKAGKGQRLDVDPKDATRKGWVKLGTVTLRAGKAVTLVGDRQEGIGNNKVAHFGRVMLLLNRRASQETVWRAD